MIKVKVKKIWLGKVSVRDYVVEMAKQRNEDLFICCGNDFMIVDKDEVGKAKPSITGIKSIYNGKVYGLVDFKWKPNQTKQLNLLS